MQKTRRVVQIARHRHAVETGRGTQRSLNGIDGDVFRDWLRKSVD